MYFFSRPLFSAPDLDRWLGCESWLEDVPHNFDEEYRKGMEDDHCSAPPVGALPRSDGSRARAKKKEKETARTALEHRAWQSMSSNDYWARVYIAGLGYLVYRS